jgi:chromosome segregation ATPase
LAWQKRKAVNAEQRVARAMKLEAEKFKASQKKLQMVKRDYFLWQLFHVESDRQKREKEVEAMREVVEDLENDIQNLNEESKAAKKKRAEAQSTDQDAQKKLDKLRRNLRKNDEPIIIKHRQKIAHTEEQLKKNQDAVSKMDRDAKIVKDSLQELQEELESTKRETVRFEKRREDMLKSQPLLSLQDKDLEELEQKQAEVRAATVKLDQILSKFNQEQQVDRDRLATLNGT